MIKAPIDDAEAIISERFPCPELIKTFAGDGKERWLKCHLNPCPAEGDIDTVEVRLPFPILTSQERQFHLR